MNVLNGLVTNVFDVVMTPLELLGSELAIVLISGIFGILAMVVFKYISWQKGIVAAKDKIKGHMIEIRIYQDDLVVVGKAVGKVLFRNTQYLGLNFLPIMPLLVPFVLLLSQLVVRYGYDPLPEGQTFTLMVELEKSAASRAGELRVDAPDWVDPGDMVVVRAPADGKVYVSVRDARPGAWEFGFAFGDGAPVAQKRVVIGDSEAPARWFQPDRTSSFWEAWLLPAEQTLGSDTSIAKIAIEGGYPQHVFSWMPADGEFGLVLGVFIYSILFGAAVLKPLGVTI